MRARWFLCWHEHELDLSCFVVLRLDWTREPRLKYGFEMDWRLLYRSQTGHTFKQKRKMIKQKVSLHWLCDCDGIGNPVVFGCFLPVLVLAFLLLGCVSRNKTRQGSFFCRSASSHCQGLWPVIFDKPEVAGCWQLPGLFVLEFQIQIKQRKETHVLPEKRQKPALQSFEFETKTQVGHWFVM